MSLVLDTLIVLGMATVSLGTINERDGIQERQFLLRNDGQQTVVLQQGYTSCGCTTIDFQRGQALQTGDTARVTLRFNPRGKGGEFHEVGTLVYTPAEAPTAQNGRKHVQLSLVGQCISSEETLLRQFPIKVSQGVRLSANRFDLGYMNRGDSKERHVTILYTDKGNKKETRTIRFTVDDKTPKGLQHIAYPLTIGDKQVTITLDVVIR
jgi:hypothetical protein